MSTSELTYTQAAQRLEEIISQLESNELDIDQLTSQLKEAQSLLAFCKQRLFDVEQDVKLLLPTEA